MDGAHAGSIPTTLTCARFSGSMLISRKYFRGKLAPNNGRNTQASRGTRRSCSGHHRRHTRPQAASHCAPRRRCGRWLALGSRRSRIRVHLLSERALPSGNEAAAPTPTDAATPSGRGEFKARVRHHSGHLPRGELCGDRALSLLHTDFNGGTRASAAARVTPHRAHRGAKDAQLECAATAAHHRRRSHRCAAANSRRSVGEPARWRRRSRSHTPCRHFPFPARPNGPPTAKTCAPVNTLGIGSGCARRGTRGSWHLDRRKCERRRRHCYTHCCCGDCSSLSDTRCSSRTRGGIT